MSDSSTEVVTRVELQGVQIKWAGPIRDCYLSLKDDVTVLYGLNGAGKSHVLSAVAQSLGPDRGLIFGWREIHLHFLLVDHLTNKIDVPARATFDHPWRDFRNRSASGVIVQAAWDSIDEYLASRSGREQPKSWPKNAEQRGATARKQVQNSITTGALVDEFEEQHVRPFLSLHKIDSSASRPLATLLLAANPEAHLEFEDGQLRFSNDGEVFWPVAFGFIQRRFVITQQLDESGKKSLGRIRFALRVGEPAHTEWIDQVKRHIIDGLCNFHAEIYEGDFGSEIYSQLYAPFRSENFTENFPDNFVDNLMVMRREHPDEEEEIKHWGQCFLRSLIPELPIPAVVTEQLEHARTSALEEESMWYEVQRSCGEHLGQYIYWQSAINQLDGSEPPPLWAGDTVSESADILGRIPINILDESASEDNELLSSRPDGIGFHLIDSNDDGWFRPNEVLTCLADRLSESTNSILETLLPSAPTIRFKVNEPTEWSEEGPISWEPITPGSDWALDKDGLSDAQVRWATFAVRLADLLETRRQFPNEAVTHNPVVVLIDEPERALHRRAERYLTSGLVRLAKEHNLKMVIASHSPTFFSNPDASLQHVHRDSENYTVVDPLPSEMITNTAGLGLDPADLLQLCRAALLVEGQHELVLFDELIGTELKQLGVELLCMRGAKSLQAWDAQLFQRFTDMPIVVLVDNDNHERLAEIWLNAQDAHNRGDDYLEILKEFKIGGKGPEGKFLQELCSELIKHSQAGRFRLYALEAIDIPLYLPPSTLAPEANGKTWEQLRVEAQNKGDESGEFKKWLTKTYDVDFSEQSLREAAKSMDSVPEEFTRLLNHIDETVRSITPG